MVFICIEFVRCCPGPFFVICVLITKEFILKSFAKDVRHETDDPVAKISIADVRSMAIDNAEKRVGPFLC